MKAQMEVEELKAKIELLRAQARAALATAGLKELDAVEQETGVKHQRELDKAGAQSRANIDYKIAEALGKPLKEGEKPPDILPMIGWKKMSEQMERESARGE